MQLRIRQFELSDLSAILEIEREAFPKVPWSDVAFQEWFLHEPEGFLVAEREGKVVGYIICSRNGYIVSIAVRKNERGKGIGTALFKTAEKKLKLKRSHLALHCRVSNTGAIKFFESLGFKEVRRIKAYYENGEDAIEMIRRGHG